jgi:ribosomal protein S12 methylthiotransferase
VHPGVRVYSGDLPHVRYLKVSEGCDHGCAFCAIPLMRGRHRSFDIDDVVREAQLLELQGAREVNLVAQDLAHYGRDRRTGVGLADLLEAVLAETSVPWIRLLYIYAAGLTDRVLDLVAHEPRLVKYLDMPIQHGSDPVLQRMRRPERAAGIRATVARVRDAVPEVALRTTCIVGFPGESEDDVRRLLDLLEEVQFERVGVFTYSAQEGTRAAELWDDVPEPVKRERLERVTERQRLISGERYDGRVGGVAQAIVDFPYGPPEDDGEMEFRRAAGAGARLSWQADDIDGITTLDRSDLAAGSIVEVRVDAVVDDYDFVATVRGIVSVPTGAAPTRRGRALPLAPTAPTTAGSFGR